MNLVRTILAMMLVIGCILLTAGCTSQSPAINENIPATLYTDSHKLTPTPDPNSTLPIQGGNQISISNFTAFLAKWNEKMHWGFSSEQIQNYSGSLGNGILKKYKTFPDYPSLEIPDLKPFCLEVGDAIGLSKNQSEIFATTADNELRRDKIASNPPLTRPIPTDPR